MVGRGEEARAELPVRGEADAIAGAAERLGDRGDDPDLAGPVEVAEPLCRGRAALGRLERPAGRDAGLDLGRGDDLAGAPGTLRVEGHELDEADDHAPAAPEIGEVLDLVV